MASPLLKMKALSNFLLCLLWVILLGCTVQDINNTATMDEELDAGEFTFWRVKLCQTIHRER